MPRPSTSSGGLLGLIGRLAEFVATYGLAAFVLTLPLEFTALWLPQQLSRLVLLVVTAAFIYLVVIGRRKLRVPRAASVWLLLLFVAAALISWTLTRAPGSGSSLLDVTVYPLVGLAIANLALTETDLHRAWSAFLISGLGVALTGGFLYLTHLTIWTPNPVVAARMNITFADPNITARFLTLCACAAVLMYAARQGKSWLAFATAIGCAAVLPLTFSRSGLALFIVGILLAIAVAYQHRRAAAIGVSALVVFALSTGVNPDTRSRASDAVETVATAVIGKSFTPPATASRPDPHEDNRTYLIGAGLRMFEDHPLQGVGFGGYQNALVTDYKRFLPTHRIDTLDTLSHTSLVTVMAEQGIIGTLLLLAFLIQLAREAVWARFRRDRWSAWTVLAGTLIIPIFMYSQIEGRFIQEPYLWLALGLFYSAQMLASSDLQAERARELIRPAA